MKELFNDYIVRAWDRFPKWLRYSGYRKYLKHKKFVFLLCPPASGSTLIMELIQGCERVSSFETEGQWLEGAKDILGTDMRWNIECRVDWIAVRNIFLENWDLSQTVLFEKSPPHLIRAKDIEKFFDPVYFIISIRNPYAQIEGMLRRNWAQSPETAAEFWVRCAQHQLHNINSLKRTLFFRYEDLTEDTNGTIEQLQKFLPELHDLSHDRVFSAHNITGGPIRGIQNLNERKIASLGTDSISRINDVLKSHMEIVQYFGYQLI